MGTLIRHCSLSYVQKFPVYVQLWLWQLADYSQVQHPIHNELSFEMFLAMFVLLTTSGGTMHGIILYCSVCQMGVRQWTRGRTFIYMEEYEHLNDINVHDGPGRLDMCAWGGGVRNCVGIYLPYSTWALIEFICSFFHSIPKPQIM